MSTRNAIVAFDYDAREPDELSVRRAEPVVLVSEATDEPGWVLARLSSGREGLVPLNYLQQLDSSQPVAHSNGDEGEATRQPPADTAEAEADADAAEALGRSRALPDWGYDHGLDFEELHPEHPLWLQSALEGFVHALLFNTTPWRRADAHVRTVMRHRGQRLPSDSEPVCEDGEGGEAAQATAAPEGAPEEEEEEAAAQLEAYARQHRAAVRAARRAPLRAQRYLVAEAGSWGLGNRLSALVSCLALALATNRTLLVRGWFAFPSTMGELFAAPAGWASWDELAYVPPPYLGPRHEIALTFHRPAASCSLSTDRQLPAPE